MNNCRYQAVSVEMNGFNIPRSPFKQTAKDAWEYCEDRGIDYDAVHEVLNWREIIAYRQKHNLAFDYEVS